MKTKSILVAAMAVEFVSTPSTIFRKLELMKRYEIFLACLLFFLLVGITNAQVYDPVEGQYIGPLYIAAQTDDSNIAERVQSEGILGVDVTTDKLLNIDKETAAAVIIGPVGSPIVGGLAYDPETGLLYGTDTITENLVTIDPCDGTTTIIGHTGISLLHGLALDPCDGTLYATNGQSNLYTIDKTTGEPSLVGPIGYSHIGALDFDPTSGILYGAYAYRSTNGFLITIDVTTGQGTFVADTHRINGLCFDPDGTLYASENGLYAGVQSSLYTVDKFTGEWNLVGGMGVDRADNVLCIEICLPSVAPIQVSVDIKPQSCPNPLNIKSKGVLPVAILGSEDFDVTTIDIASIRLADVAPIRSSCEDVATPVPDTNDCNCTEEGADGYLDLTLKFKTQEIVQALGEVVNGEVLFLTLTVELSDGTSIEGADCIVIRGRHKPINPADINKDGVVNAVDFAIFAQNWLQSIED